MEDGCHCYCVSVSVKVVVFESLQHNLMGGLVFAKCDFYSAKNSEMKGNRETREQRHGNHVGQQFSRPTECIQQIGVG